MGACDQPHSDNPPSSGSGAAASTPPVLTESNKEAAQDHLITLNETELKALISRSVAEAIAAEAARAGQSMGAGGSSVAGTMAGMVGVRDLVALMPPGLRSASSIYRGAKTGRIPAEKPGSQWCFDPRGVEAALLKEGAARAAVDDFASRWELAKKALKTSKNWPFESHNKSKKCDAHLQHVGQHNLQATSRT